MEDADLRLDGNAAAGVLQEVFVRDATVAIGVCATCGARGELGGAHLYVHAPGLVLRCRVCQAVLMRIVEAGSRRFLDVRGIASLEL
jgi:Family of unknown function (DUF6510)